jgi:hypothetical protein
LYVDGGFGRGTDGDVDGFGHAGSAVFGEANEEFEGGRCSGLVTGGLWAPIDCVVDGISVMTSLKIAASRLVNPDLRLVADNLEA